MLKTQMIIFIKYKYNPISQKTYSRDIHRLCRHSERLVPTIHIDASMINQIKFNIQPILLFS